MCCELSVKKSDIFGLLFQVLQKHRGITKCNHASCRKSFHLQRCKYKSDIDIATARISHKRFFCRHHNTKQPSVVPPVMFSHKAWKKELTVFKSAIEGSSHRTSVMKIYKLFIHETLIWTKLQKWLINAEF